MSSSLKPITLHSHASGPNPWKVATILRELDIPYKNVFVDFAKIKEEPYINLNPNGRVPTIEDPNTGYTIWESGAIIQYLVSQYDKDHKISFSDRKLQIEADQWLFFQASGQGPYFGQFMWFSFFHPNKEAVDSSVVERYRNEVHRVVGVIDLHLTRTKSEYLVGNKASYADLSFVSWLNTLGFAGLDPTDGGKKNLAYKKWFDSLNQRKAVQEAREEQGIAMAEKK